MQIVVKVYAAAWRQGWGFGRGFGFRCEEKGLRMRASSCPKCADRLLWGEARLCRDHLKPSEVAVLLLLHRDGWICCQAIQPQKVMILRSATRFAPSDASTTALADQQGAVSTCHLMPTMAINRTHPRASRRSRRPEARSSAMFPDVAITTRQAPEPSRAGAQ